MSRRASTSVPSSFASASFVATVGLLAIPYALVACGDAFSGSDGAGGQTASTTTTPSTTTSSGTTSPSTSTSSQGGAGQGGSQGGAAASGGVPPTGGAGGSVPCGMECTSAGFTCCPDGCKNINNDILNCGTCGHACEEVHPYCDLGTCSPAPPCNDTECIGIAFCCGETCCPEGQLCCSVPGAVDLGPTCYVPTGPLDTCPKGCLNCQ